MASLCATVGALLVEKFGSMDTATATVEARTWFNKLEELLLDAEAGLIEMSEEEFITREDGTYIIIVFSRRTSENNFVII
jgi:hypothetical protein